MMSDRRQETITIHQFLHGYKDGHRLLSSSTKPDTVSAKKLLTLSDLSGQNVTLPQTGYLTGYPLPKMGAYAIARTWLANEMSRPGCVWTHTLLVDFSDLASLKDSSLLTLFKRPMGPNDFQTYQHTLTFDPNEQIENFQQIPTSPIIKLMVALYEHPDLPIIASINEDLPVDKIAFALWLQQWPKLRRNFRFCTWTPTDRSKSGEKFDLQFVPFQSTLIGIRRNESDKFWVDFATSSHTHNDENSNSWVTAFLNLQNDCSTCDFLWRFGAEANSGRADFIPLVKAWKVIEGSPEVDIESAITIIKSFKPPLISLTRLVLQILIQLPLNKFKITNKNVVDFLVDNLSLLEGKTAVNENSRIAHILWNNAPNYIWKFFKSKSTLKNSIAQSAAKIMTPESALQGAKGNPDLFCAALEANFKLAYSTSVWEAPDPLPERIAKILDKNNKLSKKALSYMIDADSKTVPSIAIEMFGQEAIDAFLKKFESSNNINEQDKLNKWFLAVRSFPEFFLTAVDQCKVKKMKTLAIIASHLELTHTPLSSTRDEWYRAIKNAEGELGDFSFQFHTFILARALTGISPEPAELINYSFEPLHNDLLESKKDKNAWIILDSILPDISFWFSWDLAHRLRLGVTQTFIKNDLSPKYFVKFAKDDKTFERILNNAAYSSKGISYLKKVVHWFNEHPTEENSYRLAMIKKVAKKYKYRSNF